MTVAMAATGGLLGLVLLVGPSPACGCAAGGAASEPAGQHRTGDVGGEAERIVVGVPAATICVGGAFRGQNSPWLHTA